MASNPYTDLFDTSDYVQVPSYSLETDPLNQLVDTLARNFSELSAPVQEREHPIRRAIKSAIGLEPGQTYRQPETAEEWKQATVLPPKQPSPFMRAALPAMSVIETITGGGKTDAKRHYDLLNQLRGAGQKEYMDALGYQQKLISGEREQQAADRRVRQEEGLGQLLGQLLGEGGYDVPESVTPQDVSSIASLMNAMQNMGKSRPLTPLQKQQMELYEAKGAAGEELDTEDPLLVAAYNTGALKKDQQGVFDPKDEAQLAFQITSNLRQDQRVKDALNVQRSATAMQQVWNDAVKSGSPESKAAIDQALITLFNKVLDPGSVVRESEYARTPEGQAVLQRIPGFVDKLTKGGAGVTDAFRDEMVRIASELSKAASQAQKGVYWDYKSRAQNMGIPIEKVFGSGELRILNDIERKIGLAHRAMNDPKATAEQKAAAQRLLNFYGEL